MKFSDIEVTLVDHSGNDLSVVNAARVSFANESTLGENGEIDTRDVKLINYLASHQHTSPFNHAFVTMRIKAPILVSRQLVKHSFMPINEVSRRYVTFEPEFYQLKWRAKADNVKQGSAGEIEDPLKLQRIELAFHTAIETSLAAYEFLLSEGVCAEQARAVLPLNSMTEWIWSGTVFAWSRMVNLRIDPHAQKETQLVALKANEIMKELYPVSWNALIGE